MKNQETPKPRRTIALSRNLLNYSLGDHPKDVETPDPISLTTPHMADGIEDLISKFIKGQEVPIQSDPYFHGNLPEVDKMDKIEREIYSRQVRATIVEAQQVIADKQAESRKLKLTHQQEEIDRLRKLQTPPPIPPPLDP